MLFLSAVLLCAVLCGSFSYWKKYQDHFKLKFEKDLWEKRLVEFSEQIQKLEAELKICREKDTESEKKLSVLETEKSQDREKLSRMESDYENQLAQQKSYYEEKLKDKDSHFQEQEKRFKQQMEHLPKEFENLSHKIFTENTKFYREQTTKNLIQTLQPFQKDIENFKKSVISFESKGASLDNTLKEFRSINKQMSQQTSSLEQALKGETKTQGQFGEMILKNILEKSGLKKGRDFDTQVTLKDSKGNNYTPDVVVYLPDKKSIIIDSKTSLKPYLDYSSSSKDLDQKDSKDDYKKTALDKLLKSVKTHIKDLASKSYHFLSDEKEGRKSPDFTLMFIPSEGIFNLIVEQELFEMGWSKSIVLVSPTNLYATLKVIDSMWKIERQNKNALKIAEEGGKLYDKFCSFVKNLKDIGKNIQQAQNSYDQALNKLAEGKGNIVSKIEGIKTLGANAKKNLTEHFSSEGLKESKEGLLESGKDFLKPSHDIEKELRDS